MKTNINEMWRLQRISLLKELRALHPRAEAIVDSLEIVDEAIRKSRTQPRTTKYVKYGEPIEVVMAAVTDIGEPASRAFIVQAVLDGGWRGGTDDLRYRLEAAVDYHTKRQGRSKNLIKLVNEQVGLYEWDDALFT